MSEQQLAEMAAKLLNRAQLTGAEVPAFNAVMQWLEEKCSPSTTNKETKK